MWIWSDQALRFPCRLSKRASLGISSMILIPQSKPEATNMTEVSPPFRVLVAGGSVVGLVLVTAGESRDRLPGARGARDRTVPRRLDFTALSYGQSSRAARNMAGHAQQHFDENGDLFAESAVLRLLTERTCQPILFMETQFYIKTLLGNIPTSSRCKIQDHKGVTAFREYTTGVTVVTDNGEEIQGSILVGANSVHYCSRLTGQVP